MRKKIIAVLAVFTLCTVIPVGHVHDETCGYDPETDSGCVYDISTFQWEGFGN